LFRLGRKRNQNSGKIVRIPTFLSSLNIGTLLFGTILIYIFITLILYLTQKHITIYEVVEGTISGNYRYSALALKEETVVDAEESGYITYYAREGVKANAGMLICAVGASQASAATDDSALAGGAALTTSLSDENLSSVKSDMLTFAVNFDEDTFADVYELKADLKSLILQSTTNDDAGEYVTGSYEAPSSGFVVYSIDGMEALTEDDLTEDIFDLSAYSRDNLRLNTSVTAGDAIYKLIDENSWYLYFPVDDKLRTQLESLEKVSVRFLKDGNTFSAPFEMITVGGDVYGKVTLTSSLVRYVTDRFLEIELVLERKNGLKIPVSSIAEKVFVRVPEEYVTENESTQSEVRLIRETYNSDGTAVQSNVTANVYSYDEEKGDYLLSPELFEIGDYVVMPGTSKKYQITEDEMKTIQGVYNVNKGYAVFREVEIIDENEQFCIVTPDDYYGLNAHDRIALDASRVETDEIIY